MGGFIHIDHLLLTPRGVLVLDTRRVAGLIFGGDQMSDWTVMGRGHRFTFDNPQPALYDRIAAVKALVGDMPVEGRLLFSNVGKFTKGIPKWVLMLDGIEVEFPVVDQRHEVIAAGRAICGCLEPAGRAAAAEPAPVHQSLGAGIRVGRSASAARRISLHCGWWRRPRFSSGLAAQLRDRRARRAADSRVRCAVTWGCGSRSRGNRYGASVSIISRSAGMCGTACRRALTRGAHRSPSR